MVVVDAAAAAGDGVAGAPSNEKGKDDYRHTLLPEKRKWSESDQEAASREWQELRERVAAASGTVANGAVSPVLVSFRGRVAARRDMGKALCFLSIHSLHRGTITTREASNWQVQEKGETLQVLVDLSRWEGQGDFFVEAGLLRIEAEIMIEGYCGKSEKHGDPLVYARWARMTRAKPHPVYIATLLEHCTQHRLPVGRVAESLEMDVAAVEALTRLEAKPMRKQAARISRVMQGNNAQASRARPPKITPEQQRELDDSQALRAKFPIIHLGRCDQLEGAWSEGRLPVQVSLPEVKMDETEQMRREKYSHGKKEPQVRWYVHRLRQLIRAYSLGAEAPFPYGEGPPSAEGGAGEKQGPAECATAPVGGPVKPAEPSAAEEEKDGDGSEDGEGWVVVDIGGGRGDLAINLARLLPRLRVHMMDIHTPSLRDAEKAAAKFGPAVHSRCSFRVQDVTQLFSAPSLLPPHIVHRESNGKIVLVGLHCCGGLTDAILALARRHRVAFLCCPCCFLKHAHLRSLAHDSDFAAPAGCIVCPSSAQPDPSYASDDVRGAASGALAEGGEMEGQASGETKGNSSQRSLHDQGCWEASEWELHWDRLARLGELTPQDGDAFADTNTQHQHAMHALAAARLSRFDLKKWRVGLLAFPERYSGRHLVLAGVPRLPGSSQTSHS